VEWGVRQQAQRQEKDLYSFAQEKQKKKMLQVFLNQREQGQIRNRGKL
jgi:hypothetical protein